MAHCLKLEGRAVVWSHQGMSLVVRSALRRDAENMVELLNQIIERGGTTAHRRLFTDERITEHYIKPPLGISCVVAIADAGLLGFQALEWCDPDWSGPDPLPSDWAVVATFVSLKAQGLGVGRRLFEETVAAARASGVRAIDATIRKENTGGLAFYGRLGFMDYRQGNETVSKKFDLA